MKKILLLGDSIRLGYDKYVKASMEGLAEVYFPSENSTFTTNILRNLHNWTDALRLYEADAVHWNAGLWDTVRIYGDAPLISPDTYAENVGRIFDRVRFLFPTAVQIFATSTPVMEKDYIPDFETRTNADVETYNRLAREVLEARGAIINDLYGPLKPCHESLHSDQTHFYTKEGTVLIGNRVASVLCDALGLDKNLLKQPDMETYPLIRCRTDRDDYVRRGNIYVRK